MGGGVFKGVKGSKFRRFGFSFIFIEGRFLVFDYYVDVFIFVGYWFDIFFLRIKRLIFIISLVFIKVFGV